jgi:hypothetical protein
VRNRNLRAFMPERPQKTLIANDKVIDQFNVKVLTCRDQLLRDCDIFNIYVENVKLIL